MSGTLIISQVGYDLLPIGMQGPPGPPGTASGTYQIETSPYYVNFATDNATFFGMDASSGNVSIYLPTATSGNKGNFVDVKKIDSSSHDVFIVASGQAIDSGSSTFTLYQPNSVNRFTSTGTGYAVS